ncbi:hypothetical protein GWK47_047332 [Chionoecetes opilio]|uniref:Uncharacterized protein n=1 Tax=Chionoecetes opilio TaxID=41210 RepID=A0A8J5CVH1_CHIOP|nr:hypothetical protein GWK47_047332 [Chionoecetes opilio]
MSNDVVSSSEAEGSLSLPKPVVVVKTEDFCHEDGNAAVTTKTLELHLSSDDLEKLLKDGRLERQSDELYRAMEEASKEMEQIPDTKTIKKEDKGTSSSQNVQPNASSVTPVVIKRKRGRPRKDTYLPTTTADIAQSLVHDSLPRNARGRNASSPVLSESIEDVDGDSDSEFKHKRSRKSKILHDDYVADFNTSDEEEGSKVFHRLSGRGRGRGKRKNCEFPESFNDFFSSCNEFFGGKKSTLLDDCVDDSIFEDVDECGDDEQNIPKETQSGSSPQCKHEVMDGIEGLIGPGGQTRVQIVNTGDTTVIDDEENYIYNIITTTGEKESITPLVIPKAAGDVVSKGRDEDPPSPKAQSEGEGTDDSIVQGEDMESQATSKETQYMQQLKDSSRQASGILKQKYYQALQELKKKPQVSTFADLVYGAANFLTDDQLIFFTMQLKNGCSNPPGVKYSVREKMLALAFYLQNPEHYKWLSSIFHLPGKVILERWLDGITRSNPDEAKRLVYNVYTRYIFRP